MSKIGSCLLRSGLLFVVLFSGCNAPCPTNIEQAEANIPDEEAEVKINIDVENIVIAPGETPFVSFVTLPIKEIDRLASIKFTIEPKVGTLSAPINVTYAASYLQDRGYLKTDSVIVPVFGLYAGYKNTVALQVHFLDGTKIAVPLSITTDTYTDGAGNYAPNILVKRLPESQLGFDFFAMKSTKVRPVIVDTDGEIRWAMPGNATQASIFDDNGFVLGIGNRVLRLELDGSTKEMPIEINSAVHESVNIHHNIDAGKHGLLVSIDTAHHVESTLVEMTPATGDLTHEWDLAEILGDFMRSHGDDPIRFVRPGVDWFPMNASTYDPRDDSVIISSRENFVIKLDYLTGNIIWIFGDPTKYWYTFPSLASKALLLNDGGLYPIGQHGVYINSDGDLALFNNGRQSQEQPEGMPLGENRSRSVVSAYAIDPGTMTARNTWNFESEEAIYTPSCGSAYEGKNKSLLINYPTANPGSKARLMGLDANHDVVFDFEYNTYGCETSWNAVIVPLEDIHFQ